MALILLRNDVMRLCRHFRYHADRALLLKYIDSAQLESDGAASLKSVVTDSKTVENVLSKVYYIGQ